MSERQKNIKAGQGSSDPGFQSVAVICLEG